MKYAHIERERKFLLAGNMNLVEDLPYVVITDHYVKNTRLRFRMVSDKFGITYKLTQKAHGSTGQATVTTIYLKESEYILLNIFNSVSVEKIRYIRNCGDFVLGIDKYLKGNDEIWLAEIEFNSDEEMKNFSPSFSFLDEVTGDANFNGYTLAQRFETVTESKS